jgi:DNA-binding response OmpR family regulator
VVILTTSAAETDKISAYDNYVNSYLVKPVDYSQFVALMQSLGYYWLAWNDYPYERNSDE